MDYGHQLISDITRIYTIYILDITNPLKGNVQTYQGLSQFRHK